MAVVLGQTDDLLPPVPSDVYRETIFEWLKHAHGTMSSIPREPKEGVIKDEPRDLSHVILEACALAPEAEYVKKVVEYLGVELTANNEM